VQPWALGQGGASGTDFDDVGAHINESAAADGTTLRDAALSVEWPNAAEENTMRTAIALITVCILAACSADRPDTVVSPKLDSGITSSNGGGTRTLGNQPNLGVTTPTAPAK